MSLLKSNSLSQQNSPVAHENLFTMALVKFSHATTLVLQAKPTWTHLPQRDNMFAVLDLVSSKRLGNGIDRRNVMKVVRGDHLLESIDLDNLQQQVIRDEESAGLTSFQDADRQVIIIVKVPLLAMRYPLPNGQIRRIQMKFVQDYDYTMTVGLLQRLNLPIRTSNPSSRPPTALPNHFSNAQQRPASEMPQPQEGPSNSQRGSVSGPSDCDITARSSSAMLGSSPYLVASHLSRLAERSGAIHRSTSLFDHRSRDELSSSSRPFSSSTILDTGSALQHAVGTLADPSPGTYSTASRTIQEISLKPSSAMKCSLAVGSEFGSLPAQINSTMAMPRRALFEKELTGKKSSSSAGIDNDNYLDQLLPPKRELPFAKPASKPPSRDALPIPLSSLSVDVLSLPCPVRIKEPVKAQAAAPEAKAKHLTSAAVEPSYSSTELPDNPISNHKPSIAPTSSMYNTASMPQSSPPLAYGMGNGPPTSVMPARGNSDDRSRPQGPTGQTRATADNVSDEYFARIDAFVQRYRNRPVAEAYVENAGADSAAFAALPEAERLAAIDAEIVDCIGDDSFLQLCEDVEKSWKRIALGF